MAKEKTKKVDIVISGYDETSVEKSAAEIIRKALQLKLKFRGPIPLPTKIQRISTIRSPHIYKDSWEQFERRTHRRIIRFFDQEKVISTYQQFSLPRSVEIKVNF